MRVPLPEVHSTLDWTAFTHNSIPVTRSTSVGPPHHPVYHAPRAALFLLGSFVAQEM